MRIALFGQPRVVAGDDSREFGLPRKTLNVLAFLVLNRERPVSRDSVAFALFPDEEEENARASLRRNLSYLLASLPQVDPERRFVVADTERLYWNAKAPSRIDVIDFERAVAEGRDDDAIAAYGGELLPTLYDDWTVPRRERLRDLFHLALARTVARERELRRFDTATLAARRLLEEDPWREDIVRSLMTVRFEAGDRAGALAAFERFNERVRGELRAEPMPETAALREAIVRGERLATSAPQRVRLREAIAPAIPEPVLPFVGREDAFASALEVWHDVARGSCRVLCIAGEAGVGKSRFALELARAVEREGGFVTRAETTAGGERRPYESIVEALRAPVRSRASSSRERDVWQREVARFVDESAATRESGDPFERQRLFEAVRRAVLEAAGSRPFALFLEDLHWAGSATIDLLEYLAVRLDGAPVLIAITMRTDELSRAHPLRTLAATLERREIGHEVVLERLPPRAMERAARSALPSLDDVQIAGALARSDGVPLVLVETLRDLAAGRATDASGIDELIGERFARLPAASETALAFAAVIGARFDLTTLAAATGWRNDEVAGALGASIELGLVRAAVGRTRALAFAFTHHVIHAAAYARVAVGDREAAHGLVARALDALPEASGVRAAEIARHYGAAGDRERAMRRYLDATRYALGVYANGEAADLAAAALALEVEEDAALLALRFDLTAARERALERLGRTAERRSASFDLAALAERLDDDERRCDACERVFAAHEDDAAARARALDGLERLAARSPRAAALADRASGWEAYVAVGDHVRARDAFARAAIGFERLGDRASALRARLAEIEVLVHGRLCAIGEVRDAIAALRPVIEAYDDPSLHAEFYRKAAVAIGAFDYAGALADARRALDIALRVGDRAGEGRARQDVAFFATRLGDFDGGLAEFARARDAFADAGERYGEAQVLLSIASVRCVCGDYAPVAGLIDRIDPEMRARPFLAWRIAATLAELALRTGDTARAEQYVIDALARVETLGTRLPAVQLTHALAVVYARGERYPQARAALDVALEALPELDQPAQLARALARSALLHAIAGDAAAARADAERCATVADPAAIEHYGQIAWLLAATHARLGDEDAARAHAEAAARALADNALRMDAHVAECYARLPWHARALDYLAGRDVSLAF